MTIRFTFQTIAAAVKPAAVVAIAMVSLNVSTSLAQQPIRPSVPKNPSNTIYFTGITTINNRVDSNAILNLESKPMAAVAPAAPAPAPAPAPAQQATVTLKSRLADANARLKAAKIEARDAAKAKDKTRVAAAKTNIAAIQREIVGLKREIAAAHPAKKVKVKKVKAVEKKAATM